MSHFMQTCHQEKKNRLLLLWNIHSFKHGHFYISSLKAMSVELHRDKAACFHSKIVNQMWPLPFPGWLDIWSSLSWRTWFIDHFKCHPALAATVWQLSDSYSISFPSMWGKAWARGVLVICLPCTPACAHGCSLNVVIVLLLHVLWGGSSSIVRVILLHPSGNLVLQELRFILGLLTEQRAHRLESVSFSSITVVPRAEHGTTIAAVSHM